MLLVLFSSNSHGETLYPVEPDAANQGAIIMYTKEQLKKEGITTKLPKLESVTLQDILNTIPAKTVILKVLV